MSSVRAILERRKYTGTFVYGERNGGRYIRMRDGEIIPRRKSDKTVSSEPIIHENGSRRSSIKRRSIEAQAKLAGGKSKTAPRRSTIPPRRSREVRRLRRSNGRSHDRRSRSIVVDSITRPDGPRATATRSKRLRSSLYRRKIQERYSSEAALDRLRRVSRKNKSGRDLDRETSLDSGKRSRRSTGRSTTRRKRSSRLRQISEPDSIASSRSSRPSEIGSRPTSSSHGSRDADRISKDGSEIDQAIDALRELGEALSKAEPEDTKELLASIVTKIELYFDHEETENGRTINEFSHGKIYVRPDAGEARSTDPKSTHMNTIGWLFEAHRRRMSKRDLRQGIAVNANGIS